MQLSFIHLPHFVMPPSMLAMILFLEKIIFHYFLCLISPSFKPGAHQATRSN